MVRQLSPCKVNLINSIHLPMRQPVIHKGIQYERILDYIFWYDSNGILRQSVVLLQNRSSVRALVDDVKLVEAGI